MNRSDRVDALVDDSSRGEPAIEELARRARGGCAASFGALVERLEEPVFNFLRVRAGSASEAQDLLQDTFLRAWQKLRRYDPRRPFRPWLFTLANRQAVSRHRRRRPDVRSREPVADFANLTAEDAVDPARWAEEREERQSLWALAARVLSPEQRTALWLRYGEDLSVAEIADVLRRRRVSVRVLLHRSRARLAEHLTEPLPSPSRLTGAKPAGETT